MRAKAATRRTPGRRTRAGTTTTTRAGGGSGIGLTLCARIAALHHSRLELQSREGCGTTVTFRLPLADPPEEADHAD